jgi:hypothetical protein
MNHIFVSVEIIDRYHKKLSVNINRFSSRGHLQVASGAVCFPNFCPCLLFGLQMGIKISQFFYLTPILQSVDTSIADYVNDVMQRLIASFHYLFLLSITFKRLEGNYLVFWSTIEAYMHSIMFKD